ncbi:S-adenosyl-L-methionine-dependent methyltransferase [Chaetomium strumarium]|uniref:S-adenosyl-L-methionine-dependent methyltransferase n=1 Tax=Chaetomium strumarium TaxID=1170767 RepID=A0AAJ0H3I5_9PEZI|nr:S-adenosyl-L-methionine-dependent methyltransferase [Chaetomium strumarium]
MGKLRLSSFFHSNSPSSADAETKKQNRRSFSALSASLRHKDAEENGAAAQASKPETASQQSTSRMVALARSITAETEKLEAYMKANDLPMPSFDVDAPADFPRLPEDIQRSRQEIIYATKELGRLAHGPRESVRWGVWEFLDVLALTAVNHYGLGKSSGAPVSHLLSKLVPVDSTVTLAELQTKTTLDPINLARLLRMAMTNGIFREPSPGVIAHTAASRVLAEDEDMNAWVGFNGEDILRASGHVLQALEAHPEATSLTRAGFQFAFDTVDKEPMFATFGKDPERARRMGRAMASLTGGEGYEPSYFVDVEKGGYDFSDIDAAGGTFVDIGGSHGFMCVDLASRYKNMKFVVQDLQKTVDSAPKPISPDPQVAERITLLAHDFFTEQVTKGADVYFFRWVIHNYSNPYAIRILKNLIPALKPGARIIINDHCLREPGQENPWDERVMRRMDVVMLALLNAQERTEAEFRALFAAADERFVFKGVRRPKGCRMSIVEAVWEPEKVGKADEGAAAPAVAEPDATEVKPATLGEPTSDEAK